MTTVPHPRATAVAPSADHVRIHRLRCFGAHPGDGNPALVIEGDPSPAQARQDFARARDTTCVWIDPAGDDGVAASVDFYYPHTRSPLCLHATLAVAHVLFTRPGAPASVTVTTAMHAQSLGLVRDGDALFVRLAPQTVTQPALAPGLAARLLGVSDQAIGAAPQVASVGSPKLLVEVTNAATLHALTPNLPALADWSKQAGVNGLYAYFMSKNDEVEGRNFNHLDPRLEDSATGVAAGALTVLLGRGLQLRQGRATGRDCLIRTCIDGDKVLVGGRVETL